MDLETIYVNVEGRDIQNTTGRKTQSHGQDEGKDLKRSRQNIDRGRIETSLATVEMKTVLN